MEEESQKLRIHIWASLIIFFLLLLLRFTFTELQIYNRINLESLLLLLFGFYLIFLSSLYFKNIFHNWKNNHLWKKDILKAYLLLTLFCIIISILYLNGEQGPIEILIKIIESPKDLFLNNLPSIFFRIGLSIAFPIGIYTSLLSMKSFTIAKKENKSYSFGITSLTISLIFLIASFSSFFSILTLQT